MHVQNLRLAVNNKAFRDNNNQIGYMSCNLTAVQTDFIATSSARPVYSLRAYLRKPALQHTTASPTHRQHTLVNTELSVI